MARNIRIEGDPTAIGEVRTPPTARVPDPAKLFERRASRFRTLGGDGTGMGAYLHFLSAVASAQHRVAAALPAPEPRDETARDRAFEHEMPPIDRGAFRPDDRFRRLTDRLFEEIATAPMPPSAAEALARVRSADDRMFEAMVGQVLADQIPVESVAEHVFVAAALQVEFVREASTLPERRLRPVADGACPACGGPPVSSVIVGWPQAGGARFCACSLCATLWHHVRIKCVSCSSTAGIRYQEIDGGPGTIKAETCDNCRTYVKIFDQQKDVSFEPLADDVGSLGLDILMRGTEFRRAAFNPFLLGY